MNEALLIESEKLARSWMQHEADMLRDYLVSSVEDPRINLQSILTRHFLIQSICAERFALLMEQECRFSAAVNWFLNFARQSSSPDDLKVIQYALQHGSDNAEGIQLPRFLLQTYSSLPAEVDGVIVPNYLDAALSQSQMVEGKMRIAPAALDVFIRIWADIFRNFDAAEHPELSALEPACGSANDYRFIRAAGIGSRIRYQGFDICQKNVDNAHTLFPDVSFCQGNVFELPMANKSVDVCFFHDLLEHLSKEGIQAAVAEICRVTRWGICVGFFNMNEIPATVITPVEEYHWNTLSLDEVRELFVRHGFSPRVLHIGTLLSQRFGCPWTHNPNAYTFVLRPL